MILTCLYMYTLHLNTHKREKDKCINILFTLAIILLSTRHVHMTMTHSLSRYIIISPSAISSHIPALAQDMSTIQSSKNHNLKKNWCLKLQDSIKGQYINKKQPPTPTICIVQMKNLNESHSWISKFYKFHLYLTNTLQVLCLIENI